MVGFVIELEDRDIWSFSRYSHEFYEFSYLPPQICILYFNDVNLWPRPRGLWM